MALDLDPLVAFAGHLAGIARGMLADATAKRPDAEVKADRSFVTALDREIERRLRQEIAARFPDHGLIGEEEGRDRPGAPIQWVLDPIDGTAPFIAGMPVYGTLIAVAVDNVPIIGVMDLPAADNRWVGAAGRPTTHNGVPCRTRPAAALSGAMLACMNPDFFSDDERRPLEALKMATAWRIYGGSSMGYGLLASGRIDLCFDTRLQPYDFACYRPIIEGAGGVVTDWEGRPLTLESGPRVLAACRSELHEQALDVMRGKDELS
jgi:inositol-phosphate phosphatase / L-galactose 1-phosphate phosphatase / histidinol-phosphatase